MGFENRSGVDFESMSTGTQKAVICRPAWPEHRQTRTGGCAAGPGLPRLPRRAKSVSGGRGHPFRSQSVYLVLDGKLSALQRDDFHVIDRRAGHRIADLLVDLAVALLQFLKVGR